MKTVKLLVPFVSTAALILATAAIACSYESRAGFESVTETGWKMTYSSLPRCGGNDETVVPATVEATPRRLGKPYSLEYSVTFTYE